MRKGMPHFKLKGKVLVKRSEFDKWIETFRITVGTELNDIEDGVIRELSD